MLLRRHKIHAFSLLVAVKHLVSKVSTLKVDANAKYLRKTRRSYRLFNRAKSIMPGGQSHNARFFEPYPFFAEKARGKYIWDVDGNRYVDYWMGHTSLILGHSPQYVSSEIKTNADRGLLYGAPNRYALDLAEKVTQIVPCAEQVRFCTTGAEATMYAVRLARAFTKRKVIMKMVGGWHGYSSVLTVGVSSPYELPESAGLVSEEESFVKLGEFNNIEATKDIINKVGGDLAGIIIEPVMGAGGVVPAKRDYLAFLREDCDRLGAVLVFDEIITGFRLALGGAQEFFGIKPDLCTLGKILGGGLPVSAIGGRTEIMALADVQNKSKSERCWIGGGTFSENALCMKAGLATLKHLSANKGSIYKKIGEHGSNIRKQVDKVFSDHGIKSQTTGLGSLFATHFLSEDQKMIIGPRDVDRSDRSLEKKYYFDLIANNNIYFIPGHIGAISTVHQGSDIKAFVEATERFAQSKEN